MLPQAQKKDITIAAELPDNLVVFGVGDFLQDVFKRLIDNAVKFSKPGGRVEIAAGANADGSMVTVTIRDDGIGLSLDQQKYVFDLFKQIDRETMEQQGIGIGLTIVDRMVRLHGGSVELDSRPGQGALFTVQLPAQRHE
jgi:signal transduction histidine kinase